MTVVVSGPSDPLGNAGDGEELPTLSPLKGHFQRYDVELCNDEAVWNGLGRRVCLDGCVCAL